MKSSHHSSPSSLDAIVFGNAPFAIIRKEKEKNLLLAQGDIHSYERLSDIPRKRGIPVSGEEIDTISAIPFSQIHERGFEAVRGDARIKCLHVSQLARIDFASILSQLSRVSIALKDGLQFDRTDDEYAAMQAGIIRNEIGSGEGANFVVPRRAEGIIENFNREKALSIFRSLLEREFGSYMTFIFCDGEQYLIGASPERHLSVENGTVRMNPISGTYRKTREGIEKADLVKFLRDPKEVNELFMVLDEELKMMAQMCERGGHIEGPLLREMSKLIHTEYQLVGRSDKDVIDLFRHSMFAPTVTGSPVENACRIICKYDPRDRRYYSSALMLLGRDTEGRSRLDSTILIRMMEIFRDGRIQMAAGSTLVQDSDPVSETEEANAKLSALAGSLGACTAGSGERELPAMEKELQPVLLERNTNISPFFFEDQFGKDLTMEAFREKRITIVASDDDFAHTLGHMITRMGAEVTVRDYSQYSALHDSADLVIVGPGTGDPNDMDNPKMRKLAPILIDFEHHERPFLTICLGHQLLSKILGMRVEKKDDPSQGVQKNIHLFGQNRLVGFYNTFAAKAEEIAGVEMSGDTGTGEVYAIRGPHFSSFQFHPESVLSKDGFEILRNELVRLLEKQHENNSKDTI